MEPDVDGRARAELRRISEALMGKAPYRLEVALAVQQLGNSSFTVADVSALLAREGPGTSYNTSRNLQALKDSGFLQQPAKGGPYSTDLRHPFWAFIRDLWTLLQAQATSPEALESAMSAIGQASIGTSS